MRKQGFRLICSASAGQLDPVLLKIGRKYLEVNGIAENAEIVWDTITMQDETEAARARLYDAQAEKISGEVYA